MKSKEELAKEHYPDKAFKLGKKSTVNVSIVQRQVFVEGWNECEKQYTQQTAELQQEVERLTKALQQIIETTDGSNPTHYQIWSIAIEDLNHQQDEN